MLKNKKLPKLYIYGKIRFKDASNIFVKSKLTYFIFPILWFYSRALSNIFRKYTTKKAEKLIRFNLNNYDGFFVYQTRDNRKRVYVITSSNGKFDFIKIGKNIKNENLTKKCIQSLKKNTFIPILPYKSIKGDSRLNHYGFINCLPTRLNHFNSEFFQALNQNKKLEKFFS